MSKEQDLPWFEADARRFLDSYSKQVKEKPITPYADGSMKASPSMLLPFIMQFAKSHLDHIIAGSLKAGFVINIEQKTKLYFEFLTLYYFLIGHQLNKYLKGDQFTLFILQLHVKLLDNLPKYDGDTRWLFGANPFTRSKKIKQFVGKNCAVTGGLSHYIYKGNDFYIRDKLISDGTGIWNILREVNGKSVFEPTDDEIQGYERLKRLLLPEDAKINDFEKYKENWMLQFMIKNFHLVMKILRESVPSWDKDLQMTFFLYGCNNDFMLAVPKDFQPAWDSNLGLTAVL